MISKKLKKAYLEYWEDRIRNIDYSEIDYFCEDNELDEKQIEEILSLSRNISVTITKEDK
jgi:hypothetical protein